MKLDKKQSRLLFLGLFIISALFYLSFYFHDGIIMSVDGPTYIGMDSDREPAYCTFLWLFRTLFGEDIYLHICVILQCILAGLAAAYLTCVLQDIYSLKWISTVLMLFIQYGLTILNRFVAQRRYSYYNSICTEAVAYSLWAIFFADILNIVYKKEKKYIIRCIIWTILLISIRKHMYITYPIFFVTVIATYWKKLNWKAVALTIGSIIISFVCITLIDCTYNYANRGVFAKHTGDSTFILGNEIYVADESMAKYISDDENRALFEEIIKRADELNYNIKYAEKGVIKLEDHYSDVYDRIKFDVNATVIREYEENELGFTSETETLRVIDYNERVSQMTKDLLVPCMPGLFRIFVANAVCGFITTVLKVHTGLNELSVVVYLLYILVLIKSRKSSITPFAVLTLFSIVINVCFVSAALFSQMRYMLYNTAFFYQSGYLMLLSLRKNK